VRGSRRKRYRGRHGTVAACSRRNNCCVGSDPVDGRLIAVRAVRLLRQDRLAIEPNLGPAPTLVTISGRVDVIGEEESLQALEAISRLRYRTRSRADGLFCLAWRLSAVHRHVWPGRNRGDYGNFGRRTPTPSRWQRARCDFRVIRRVRDGGLDFFVQFACCRPALVDDIKIRPLDQYAAG
jgi:hypothetical protein